MSAPLLDEIERLGKAVDDGEVSRDDAIKSLVDRSGGGLTLLGAADLADGWAGARTRYATAAIHHRPFHRRLT